MDRRTFLAIGAVALATAGCTAEDPDGLEPAPSAPTTQDPDAAIRRRVAGAEAALIDSYRRALQADPALAGVVGPLIRQHEQHLALVAAGGTAAPTPSASGAAAPSDTTTTSTEAPTASTTPTPPDPARLLADLAAEESAARDHRIAACDGATDPGLARLLCLIGASEAQHARVLERAAEQVA